MAHNNIIHILSDGSLDTAWNSNVNGGVWSLAVSGKTIYVGGAFTHIGRGASRPYFAQFGDFDSASMGVSKPHLAAVS